jgi:hypothetical protein
MDANRETRRRRLEHTTMPIPSTGSDEDSGSECDSRNEDSYFTLPAQFRFGSTDAELKKELRKARNRESASLSRKRKLEESVAMQTRLDELENQVALLKRKVQYYESMEKTYFSNCGNSGTNIKVANPNNDDSSNILKECGNGVGSSYNSSLSVCNFRSDLAEIQVF